jgi:hypothetical protein
MGEKQMKFWTLLLCTSAIVAIPGCMSLSLEAHTRGQMNTVTDLRYKQALDCLAAVAADPAALPNYCLLADGTTKITDMESLTSMLTWTRAVGSFASGTLGATASRSPSDSWTVSTAADYRNLEAVRAACRWVLYGPDRASPEAPGLLTNPETDHTRGPHYGVADRLAAIPGCWLHVGKLRDVPVDACYTGHCGDTWVWVLPGGLEGLSQFTLVLQDIVTLNVNTSLDNPLTLVLYHGVQLCPSDPLSLVWVQELRIIKPECLPEIQAEIVCQRERRELDWWYARTDPDPGPRVATSAGKSAPGQGSTAQTLNAIRNSSIRAPSTDDTTTQPSPRSRLLELQ